MKDEGVLSIIKDLTETLSAVAAEFNDRVSKVSRPDPSIEEPSQAALTKYANSLLAERRMRRRFLPTELFHEPAWDMLLALFAMREERLPINVKTLVSFSEAPVTTSQRWIDHLYKLNLINRVTDPVDRRRIEISLSENGNEAMSAYLWAINRQVLRSLD
jgi:DNA-binding MarR family transcriptional regulator